MTSSQERFLILKTAGEESGDLILGFASPAQLEVMRNSPSWYCDGADSPVSRLKMFSQLFVILADTSEGLSLPVGFFLTSNQSEATYRRIFRCLRDECGVGGPERILFDLEKVCCYMHCFQFTHILIQAKVNAISEVYSSTSLQLSEVYWKRLTTNLWKVHCRIMSELSGVLLWFPLETSVGTGYTLSSQPNLR